MFKLITFRSDWAFWPLAEPTNSSIERPASTLAAVLATPRRLAAAIRAELAARRAAQTLASLDERMLRDIGIERDQLTLACRRGRQAVLHASDLRVDLARWS